MSKNYISFLPLTDTDIYSPSLVVRTGSIVVVLAAEYDGSGNHDSGSGMW